MQKPELWERLRVFSLDDPEASFPFSARLARENGWSREYTERVVEEYKRFAYLAFAAGHPVTPSVDVDQVWHLHLTYTRSYWEEFCPLILEGPLHHGPTKGGKQESAKFHDWYARTRESYEAEFASPPPEDIWPSARERFAPSARIRQVSESTHWIIRKPSFSPVLRPVLGILALLALVTGCSLLGIEEGPVSVFLGVVFTGFFAVALIGMIIHAMTESSASSSQANSPSSARKNRAAGGAAGASSSRPADSSSSSGCGTFSPSSTSDAGGDSGCGGGGCGGGCGCG